MIDVVNLQRHRAIQLADFQLELVGRFEAELRAVEHDLAMADPAQVRTVAEKALAASLKALELVSTTIQARRDALAEREPTA